MTTEQSSAGYWQVEAGVDLTQDRAEQITKQLQNVPFPPTEHLIVVAGITLRWRSTLPQMYLVFRYGDGRLGESSYLLGVYTSEQRAEERRKEVSRRRVADEVDVLAVVVDTDIDDAL